MTGSNRVAGTEAVFSMHRRVGAWQVDLDVTSTFEHVRYALAALGTSCVMTEATWKAMGKRAKQSYIRDIAQRCDEQEAAAARIEAMETARRSTGPMPLEEDGVYLNRAGDIGRIITGDAEPGFPVRYVDFMVGFRDEIIPGTAGECSRGTFRRWAGHKMTRAEIASAGINIDTVVNEVDQVMLEMDEARRQQAIARAGIEELEKAVETRYAKTRRRLPPGEREIDLTSTEAQSTEGAG